MEKTMFSITNKLLVWTLFVALLIAFVVPESYYIDEDIFYQTYGDLNINELQSAMRVHNVSIHHHLNKLNKTMNGNTNLSRIFFPDYNKSITVKTHYEAALFHYQLYFAIENLIYNIQKASDRRRTMENHQDKDEFNSLLTKIGISDPNNFERAWYYVQSVMSTPNYPKVPIKSSDKIQWGLDGISRFQFNFDLTSMNIFPSPLVNFGGTLSLPATTIKFDKLTVIMDGDNELEAKEQNYATIHIKKPLPVGSWKPYIKLKGEMIFNGVTIHISNPEQGDMSCDRKVKFKYQTKEDKLYIVESWPRGLSVGQMVGGKLVDYIPSVINGLIEKEIKDEINDMPCFLSTVTDMRLGVQVPDPYQKILSRVNKMKKQLNKLSGKDIGALSGVVQAAEDKELKQNLTNNVEKVQTILDAMILDVEGYVDNRKQQYCKKVSYCKDNSISP